MQLKKVVYKMAATLSSLNLLTIRHHLFFETRMYQIPNQIHNNEYGKDPFSFRQAHHILARTVDLDSMGICSQSLWMPKVEWPNRYQTIYQRNEKCCFETLGPAFKSGIQQTKQLAHYWYLPCCQCTGTCSHVSSWFSEEPSHSSCESQMKKCTHRDKFKILIKAFFFKQYIYTRKIY